VVISSLSHLVRLSRAGFVFAREGVFALVDPRPLPMPARAALRVVRLVERPTKAGGAVRLAAALTKLGPTYVKLGQFLATRQDVVGAEIARDLESLQDKMAPFPQAEAEAAIAAALGEPVSRAFARFSPPIAAASIAQVHRAEIATADGVRIVAVKVLRPYVERRLKTDLAAFFFIARLAERFSSEARRLRLTEVVATLARTVTLEMDLRLEAAALSEMAENIAGDGDFRVPAVDWERTARDVLTMEWIDGTPLNDRAALAARGLDLPSLGHKVIQSFLRHAMRDGFFHADMHPGNLFVDDSGKLAAVDFGIMGRLGPKERRFLAEILYGFITRNYRRTAEIHFEAGYVSMAKLLTLLFEVTALFEMKTRPELLLLQKTMVVVEGVARTLDPHLDMWTVSAPVVRDWIERNLGPAGRIEDAAQGAGEVGRFLSAVPGLLTRGARIADQIDGATRDGIVLAPETVAALGRADARRNRPQTVALWVIAVSLAVLAIGIMR
jgi:ubiquinone biosynthesis protein